jgi:hypothetical protein
LDVKEFIKRNCVLMSDRQMAEVLGPPNTEESVRKARQRMGFSKSPGTGAKVIYTPEAPKPKKGPPPSQCVWRFE